MVVSLIGKCDGVGIIFNHIIANQWRCDVPTDFSDGTYVIELFATNEKGSTSYYTGTFYVCDSKLVNLTINDDGFVGTFLSDWLMADVFDLLTVEFIDFNKGGDLVQKFFLGERKYIPIEIISTKKQVVVITEATYKVTDDKGNTVASGDCEINNDESMLMILYEPTEKGTFNLEVSYTVPPETRIIRCDLDVN